MVNFQEMEPGGSQLPGGRQHLVGVAVDPDIAPDFCDSPVGADQNRCPNNSEEFLAIHGFFAPGAIGFQHLMSLI